VWGNGYTELFFLDEPTALAAGHRPCFECRRNDAAAFAAAWGRARGTRTPTRAPEMDTALHRERLDGRGKRRHRLAADDLPDGAFIAVDEKPFALLGGRLLAWTASGYANPRTRPRGGEVDVLTPPSILAVFTAGYRPRWHDSARAHRSE
jgi:hypothetical protein